MRYNASHYAILCSFAIAFSLSQAPSLPSTLETVSLLRRNAIATGEELRILPLGDSITYGEGSSDGNGYRLVLYDLLHSEIDLDYIGRIKSGTMVDNDNEGYRGYPIVSIGDAVTSNYPEQPNIVLLMAGTNDVIQKHNLSTSSSALDKLTNKVINTYPDAVVLVAEITPLLDPKREAGRLEYNSAIPGVIQKYADDGTHIAVVDMGRVTPDCINATDGIHPVDEGYRLIAYAWYEAILAAEEKGWIGGPTPSFSLSHTTLQKWVSASDWELDVVVYGVISLVVLATLGKLAKMAIRRYTT